MHTQNDHTITAAKVTFLCACSDEARQACIGEKFYEEHEGKKYCVLHFPAKKKKVTFHYALIRKIDAKDFNFTKVWFPESVDFKGTIFSTDANFTGATFSAEADFRNAIFNAVAIFLDATFSDKAYFSNATFSDKTDFNSATFSDKAYFSDAVFSDNVYFNSATFSAEAYFSNATFSAEAHFSDATFSAEADFSNATFSDKATFRYATFSDKAYFSDATFSAEAIFKYATFSAKAYFRSTTFKNYVIFAGSSLKRDFGEQPRLNFQFARMEKPERVSFHTLYLHPGGFLNTDCRKFEFTDVEWDFRLKGALQKSTEAGVSEPHRLLAITYGQLADNSEANHRYHEASNFRYNAFEARRIERFQGLVPWRLDWWYWLASGYGERVSRAFIIFLVLLALFTFGYTKVGFDQVGKSLSTAAETTSPATMPVDTLGKPLGWREAAIYSLNVSILQKPEPKPLTLAAKALVSLETVLGLAQAVLLALALRRRFMR